MKFRNLLIFIIIFIILITTTNAMLNPAAVYCNSMNYEYEIQTDNSGSQYGVCTLPNNEEIEEWKFLKGEEGLEYSYCEINGYENKIIKNSSKCSHLFSNQCLFCVLPNNSEIEVTKLMNLSFQETSCGDGSCGIPENHKTCPEDCSSGSFDGYCDKVKDNICDPDCLEDSDPDCDEKKIIKEKIKKNNSIDINLDDSDNSNNKQQTNIQNKLAKSIFITIIILILLILIFFIIKIKFKKLKPPRLTREL